MKISEKAEEIHQFVSTPAGAMAGTMLQQQASEAIRDGMGSPAWKTFMCNFASNPAQLGRLMGQDDLITKPWGVIALAYLPANAMCGTGTTTGILRTVPKPFVDAIDKDLPTDEAEADCAVHIEKTNFSDFI